MVHRKGATPAGSGCGDPPAVRAMPGMWCGRGAADLHSAAHGAGRQMSRKQALSTITKSDRDRYLRERGHIAGRRPGCESPQAYKRIHQEITAAQADLVDVPTFTPRIVRMADEVRAVSGR